MSRIPSSFRGIDFDSITNVFIRSNYIRIMIKDHTNIYLSRPIDLTIEEGEKFLINYKLAIRSRANLERRIELFEYSDENGHPRWSQYDRILAARR